MKTILSILLLFPLWCPGQSIITIGGNSTAGYCCDNSQAVTAEINNPANVVIDNAGNCYFTDYGNYRVRKIATDGIITTIGGNGGLNETADGSYAVNASIGAAWGIVIDATGNIYFSSFNNHTVKKISTLGVLSTFAGTGVYGYSGNGGQAVGAQLNSPTGLAIDAASNIYIADQYNNVIRKVTPAGIISTFAGTSVAGNTGDEGPATSATLNEPNAVAIDDQGNAYISDGNNSIRKVTTDGIIHTLYAAPNLMPAQLGYDNTLHALYIGGNRPQIVRLTATDTTIYAGTTVAGFSGDGGAATAAKLNRPAGVALNAAGNLYVADAGNNRIREIGYGLDVAGVNKGSFAVSPNPVLNELFITSPVSIKKVEVVNILGARVFVGDYNSGNVVVDMRGLRAGMYFVRVNDVEVQKIIKE